MRVLKFLITGMIGISANLGVFHTLYVLGVPYLAGSIVGFLVAMFVGFVLQKYWTFKDRSLERARSQFALYSFTTLGNLALNTSIVYVLIGKLGVYHLLAQAVGAAVVAAGSFFIYQIFIFKPRQDSGVPIGL